MVEFCRTTGVPGAVLGRGVAVPGCLGCGWGELLFSLAVFTGVEGAVFTTLTGDFVVAAGENIYL